MAEVTLDLSGIPTENIKDMILRHEKQGVTNTPTYLAAVEELARRQSKYLNPERTVAHLRECAKQKRFTSYKKVSEASDTDWNQVYRQVGSHLDYILRICHARGWPLLTAICVKQNEVATGELGGDSLAGFIKGARRLRYNITDERKFLKDCQKNCFEWAENIE